MCNFSLFYLQRFFTKFILHSTAFITNFSFRKYRLCTILFIFAVTQTIGLVRKRERKKQEIQRHRERQTEKHRERQKVETKFYFTIDRQITGYD